MSNIRKTLIILLTLEVVIISYFSLKNPGHGMQLRINDKIGHFIAYSILSLNTYLVFGFNPIKRGLFFLCVLMGMGIILEILQKLIPGRECSFFDIIANSVGIGFGIALYFWYKLQSRSKIF